MAETGRSARLAVARRRAGPGARRAGAGWLIGRGFEVGRSADRYVTVKGLAETFVTADLAVWPLRTSATGNDLGQVQEQIDAGLATITAFLREADIEAAAIQPQRVEVTDLLAQPYRPEGAGESRFILAQTVIVRTGQVERVAELNQQTGELIKRGVVLVDSGAGRAICSPASTTSSPSCSPRRPATPVPPPSSSPPIPAARSPRSGAPRRGCSRSWRAIPRPTCSSPTSRTRRSAWSARSSTGSAADVSAGRGWGVQLGTKPASSVLMVREREVGAWLRPRRC
jgi:hypothetical protein